MANAELHLMDHPLILHKITMLRSVETDTKDFRQLVTEISLLIGYEATRDLSAWSPFCAQVWAWSTPC